MGRLLKNFSTSTPGLFLRIVRSRPVKSLIKPLVAFALVLAALGQPTGASAADIFHFRGQSVDASFASLDPSGCVYTGVDVAAAEQVAQSPPGAGQPSAGLFIHIFQANFCTNTVIHSASASVPLSESELEFRGKLKSATLHTTVSVFDFVSNSFFEVTVDLTWAASSSRTRENTHTNFKFDGCHFNYHFITAYRFADASGTVSDGTANLTPPLSQIAGTISSAKYGEVLHGCA
jgi:hypothetical protein